MVERQDHAVRSREAARVGLRAACTARGEAAAARSAPEGLPLPVLRVDRDAAGEHLRSDAVPLRPLLHVLPSTFRAVQDDLSRARIIRCVAVVAVAAFLVAACGGGGKSRLSKPEF